MPGTDRNEALAAASAVMALTCASPRMASASGTLLILPAI